MTSGILDPVAGQPKFLTSGTMHFNLPGMCLAAFTPASNIPSFCRSSPIHLFRFVTHGDELKPHPYTLRSKISSNQLETKCRQSYQTIHSQFS